MLKRYFKLIYTYTPEINETNRLTRNWERFVDDAYTNFEFEKSIDKEADTTSNSKTHSHRNERMATIRIRLAVNTLAYIKVILRKIEAFYNINKSIRDKPSGLNIRTNPMKFVQ